jgi:hypothetical protein
MQILDETIIARFHLRSPLFISTGRDARHASGTASLNNESIRDIKDINAQRSINNQLIY